MNQILFKKDAVISSIIDKYYAMDTSSINENPDTDESGTVFYSNIDETPNSFDGTEKT